MRKDMPKLICEDGRRGGSASREMFHSRRRKLNRIDPDNHPKRESMSGTRHYGWEAKDLNETLNPLYRFLLKQVGRPWDDVYSEIRTGLRLDKAIHLHIMQHLWQYVERHYKIADCGTVVESDMYRGKYAEQGYTVNGRTGWKAVCRRNTTWPSFFIHPETGVLWSQNDARLPTKPREVKKGWGERNQWRPPRNTRRFLDEEIKRIDGRYFEKTDGIWYELKVAPLPNGWEWEKPHQIPAKVWCHMEKGLVDGFRTDNGPEDRFFGRIGNPLRRLRYIKAAYGRTDVYCPRGGKAQLNTKELRRLGLQNG